MVRPKTLTDEQVLDTALDLVHKHGVSGLTFSALGSHCGLSAATLVQRFTNKATLTQRTLLHAWDELEALTRKLASSTPLTPHGAVDLLIGLSGDYGGIDAYGDGLLLLREDVRDPVLRARGVTWESNLTAALESRFASIPNAPSGIGYAMAAYWQGSLTWWAFRADQSLHDYLVDKLTAFIDMLGVSN
ncbi:TetR/AcrR family transcriptional regulator [Haloglycomyces albus]|uniref:TetR/AcrR family transcriptional regulator n=1 Tax=Haloglycomyces albus TaxID=526067 RepID=UPI00046CD84D|nr:TetR family transcriptional regulator [Haloglycomyces albus]